MDQSEELVAKAALALGDTFFVELINRAKAVKPGVFVGKVKKICEILELENQLAASVRYAAILARDFPARFQETISKREVGMKNKPITLRLRENQIHSGMVVYLCLDGKEEPEKDGSLILEALTGGGHPYNAYLYPVGTKEKEHNGGPMSGFNANVRFQPINVYKPADAPCGEEYVVFVNGEYLLYAGMEKHPTNRVYIFKDDQGHFQNKGCCLRDNTIAFHQFEFPLPEGVLLVSLDEVKKFRKA